MGAYLQLVTPGVPMLGRVHVPGDLQDASLHVHCTGVFTNKTPTDAYRGAGRPEATFAIERIMDELAAELGMRPDGAAPQNWIKHEEFPYDRGRGADLRLRQLRGRDRARRWSCSATTSSARSRPSAARQNDPVQLGIGISTFTEMCGLAPSRVLGSLSYGAGGWESATVRVLPTGKVEVVTGTTPHGQGHETAWSQIAADALGVPFDDVEVLHGDTKVGPKGMDTYGSRSLVVGGVAIHKRAAARSSRRPRKFAAHLLEAAEGDVEFTDGAFPVKGSPEARKTIQRGGARGLRRARPTRRHGADLTAD